MKSRILVDISWSFKAIVRPGTLKCNGIRVPVHTKLSTYAMYSLPIVTAGF
jgi:hypothetical protein